MAGSRLREIYGSESVEEGYHCNYGLNPAYEKLLSPLRISARDDQGEVRAIELQDHPFFIATLFQPERRALTGGLHPLVAAFIEAAG
jgi:CTP synthase (UTP-ammonia lyase)